MSQLSRIATLSRQVRRAVEAAGGYYLFVDAGDSEDTTLLESSLTKGSPMEAILRGAGCEYVALGNAIPTRYGQQAVAGLAEAFGRPLLCANMREQDGHLVAFEQMEFEVPTIMPEVLEDYIRRHSPIQAPEPQRIRLRAK